jgi:hypothetical protein
MASLFHSAYGKVIVNNNILKEKQAMATRGAKKTTMKKTKKLPGFFSFNNPKNILLVAVVVGFAAGGSYWLYDRSSAAQTKDLTTVQGCGHVVNPTSRDYYQKTGIILKRGSSGSCVQVLQMILKYAKYRYGDLASWSDLTVDSQFGPATQAAVINYQKWINNHPLSNVNIATDGVVTPNTWYWLQQITCPDIYGSGVRLHACLG